MTESAPITWEAAVAWLREQPGQENLIKWCFYDDPLIDSAQRFHACSEWQATRALLPKPPGTALDIGAGRGIASYALAADGYRTSALEPDPSSLVGAGAIRALAAVSGLPITVVEEWGESIPFATASFDVVLCRQVLHHARDLEKLCVEIARVLKPGGLMIATREHVISKRSDLKAFLDSHPLHWLYGGENAYLLDEYEGAIRKAGLTLESSFNPLQSNINLYPMTIADHRALLARRFFLPKAWISDLLMGWVGARMQTPGRLYSFVARKAL